MDEGLLVCIKLVPVVPNVFLFLDLKKIIEDVGVVFLFLRLQLVRIVKL